VDDDVVARVDEEVVVVVVAPPSSEGRDVSALEEVVLVEVDVAVDVAVRRGVPAETGSGVVVVGAAVEADVTSAAGERTVTSVRGARELEGEVPRGTA
jgi:hypothetical protein